MSLRDRLQDITEAQFSRSDKEAAGIRNSLRVSLEIFDRDFGRGSREDDSGIKENAIYKLAKNLKGAVRELNTLL